jgi:hypothetical protein
LRASRRRCSNRTAVSCRIHPAYGEEALARLRVDDEFVRMSTRASLIVEGVGVVGAALGDGLETAITTYQQAIGRARSLRLADRLRRRRTADPPSIAWPSWRRGQTWRPASTRWDDLRGMDADQVSVCCSRSLPRSVPAGACSVPISRSSGRRRLRTPVPRLRPALRPPHTARPRAAAARQRGALVRDR